MLEQFLIEQIKAKGGITIAEFMASVLTHPEFGYYTRQKPIGAKGDFITSPEVSQMFGEMLGVWTVDFLSRSTSFKDKAIICECGAGSGTMMSDIMRVIKTHSDLSDKLNLCIVEMGIELQKLQQEKLGDFNPAWFGSLSELPDGFSVVLANEFLDALPFRQLIKEDGVLKERIVTLSEEDNFIFSSRPHNLDDGFLKAIVGDLNIEEGEIIEFSFERDAFVNELCHRVNEFGGVALLIDYGYSEHGIGDSFQAVKEHAYCNTLENIGNADLTSHVNFARIRELAQNAGLKVYEATQGEFLKNLGIEVRARTLAGNCIFADQKMKIYESLKRLTSEDEMGTLFKVICICNSSEEAMPFGF